MKEKKGTLSDEEFLRKQGIDVAEYRKQSEASRERLKKLADRVCAARDLREEKE